MTQLLPCRIDYRVGWDDGVEYAFDGDCAWARAPAEYREDDLRICRTVLLAKVVEAALPFPASVTSGHGRGGFTLTVAPVEHLVSVRHYGNRLAEVIGAAVASAHAHLAANEPVATDCGAPEYLRVPAAVEAAVRAVTPTEV